MTPEVVELIRRDVVTDPISFNEAEAVGFGDKFREIEIATRAVFQFATTDEEIDEFYVTVSKKFVESVGAELEAKR